MTDGYNDFVVMRDGKTHDMRRYRVREFSPHGFIIWTWNDSTVALAADLIESITASETGMTDADRIKRALGKIMLVLYRDSRRRSKRLTQADSDTITDAVNYLRQVVGEEESND